VSAAGVRADDNVHTFYVTADAGGVFQTTANFSENGSPNVSTGFNPGVRADLALGYNLNETLAIELAPGFMWNSIDNFGGYSLGSMGESIDLYSVPILINFVYQIPTGTRFTPYMGGGIGADVVTFDGKNPSFSASDTTGVFAFQAEAGLRCALTKHASLSLDYRFFGTTDQDYSFQIGHFTDRVTLSGIYIHGVFLNFNWTF
jgi:opacity protein-like surface antigen